MSERLNPILSLRFALVIGTRHWTAVDFFNHLNMLYGTVTEFCTPQEASVSSFVPSPRGRALRPQILPCAVPDHVCRTQVSAARLP